MKKVDASVYIGQVVNDNLENQSERYMCYINKTDGINIMAQDVFEYLHTQEDEYNNDQLDEKYYLVNNYGISNKEYSDALPYSSSAKLIDGVSVIPVIKIANAYEKTEEDITDLIVLTNLKMVEQFELLHGYAYQKVKNIKNI